MANTGLGRGPDGGDDGSLTFTCRLSAEDRAILDRLQGFARLDSRADAVRLAIREAARSRNLLVEALPGARRAAPPALPLIRGGYR